MKVLRNIALSILVIVILLGTGLYVVSIKYEKIVSSVVVNELNTILKTHIEVSDLNVSPWLELPYVSLNFRDVLIKDPYRGSDTLLFAKDLFFHFNALDLLREDYSIKKMEISNANLKIRRLDNGSYNYLIWHSDTSAANPLLNLNSVKLTATEIEYLDSKNQVHLNYSCESVLGKFYLEEDLSKIDLYGKLFSNKTEISNINYVPQKDLKLDLGMELSNQEEFLIQFHRASINVEKQLELALTGILKKNSIDLKLESDKTDLGFLVGILPFDFVQDLKRYQPEGNASLKLIIQSKDFENKKLRVKLNTLVHRASIKSKELDKTLEFKQLKASFDNGKLANSKSSSLRIDTGFFKSGDTELNFKLLLKDFKSPKVNIAAQGKVEIADCLKNSDSDLKFNSGQFEGEIACSFHYQDSIQIKDFNLKNTSLNGSLNNIDASYGKNLFKLKTGSLELNSSHMLLSDLSLMVNGDLVELNVLSKNALTALAEGGVKTKTIVRMMAEKFDLDKLLENAPESDESSALVLPEMDLLLDIEMFNFIGTSFESLSSKASIRNQKLKLYETAFKHSKGSFNAEISMFLGSGNKALKLKTNFKNVDIQQLFKEFNSFDQKVLTEKNLTGICSGDANLSMTFDQNYNLDPNSIYSVVSLQVVNGKLIEFSPMQSVADYFDKNIILRKFFKVKELRQKLKLIEFDTLQNDFYIRESMVYMPRMTVQSSVLDMNIEGSYSFDHEIDYRMDFYITDLLTKKNKQNEFSEEILDDGTGRKRVFLKMYGPVDEPNFEMDKVRRKEFRKGIVKSEEQSVKSILKEELGLFKKDTSLQYNEKAETLDFELEWDPESRDETTGADSVQTKSDTVIKGSKLKGLLKKLIEEDSSKENSDEFLEFEDDF